MNAITAFLVGLLTLSSLASAQEYVSCAALVAALRDFSVQAMPFDEGVPYLLNRIDAWALLPNPEDTEPVFVAFAVGLPGRGKTFLSAQLRDAVQARHGNRVQVLSLHGMDDRDVAVVRQQMNMRRDQYFPLAPRFVLIVETPTMPIPGLMQLHDRKTMKAFGKPVDTHVALAARGDYLDPTQLALYDAVLINANAQPKY